VLASVGLAAGAGALLAAHPALGALVAVPLAQFVAGVASGWMVSSFNESFIHDKVAHATPEFRNTFKKLGSLGEGMQEAWYGHTAIHHYQTYKKDHVTQFDDKLNPRAKVEAQLRKVHREDLIEEDFGVTIGWKGYLNFQAMGAPAAGTALAAGTLLGGGPAFALGFALPVAVYPLFSKVYHPFTHKPAKEALAQAHPLLGSFLKTKLSRFIVRHHFVHHDNDKVNFNLMPGADWLRGKGRKASVAQEEEMRKLKLLW
jgi:hypothetical protein